MNTILKPLSEEEIRLIAGEDDLHIAPLRGDGKSFGTPTWIWSVAVDGRLYVRAYNGVQSRWYQAAIAQKAGKILAAGMDRRVQFEPAEVGLYDHIDEAYRKKYHSNVYLDSMISRRARETTLRVI
jgi:hypothetical protein